MLLHVRPRRWWRGEFFRGWSLSEEDVSFELLNMLINVTPGLVEGEFSGEGISRKGGGSSSVEFVRLFEVVQYTTDCI